jgi:outer membrane protein assembly factor BamB
MKMKTSRLWIVSVVLLFSVSSVARAVSVKAWLEEAEISRGLCVVVSAGDAATALEVVGRSGLLVHALERDATAVVAAQEAARAKGYGLDRFIGEPWSAETLPHADNSVDLVLVLLPAGEVGDSLKASIKAALRPGGKAFFQGTPGAAVKARPAGAGDWSHWEHGPDNNPVSEDQLIRAPYATQWMGGPYYSTMPAITTVADGRIFTAMGHIAHHRREEPWLNTLMARNGYNGAELWRRKLPDGYLVHRSAFVATANAFFMIAPDGKGCLLIDPETGIELDRIHTPDVPGDWKWMVLEDGVLYVLTGRESDPAETTVVRSKYPAWSWGELSAGYYADRVPWGFGDTLMAYSVGDKEVLWTLEGDTPIDSRGMVLGDDKIYYYAPESHVSCVNAQTGAEEWRNDTAKTRELIEEEGRGLSSTPGWRSSALCVYSPEVLFFQGQTRMNLVGVSTKDGSYMWHRKKTSNNPNVLFLDGEALAGIGPDGSTLVLNPQTGETIKDLGFKKRSCVRLTATSDSLFVRGMPDGITRFDRETEEITFDGAMRPACNDGVIGANGMLYVGPWPCDCGLALIGTAGLCSAQPFTADPVAARLSSTDAAAPVVAGETADWDAYRGGTNHDGSVDASLSGRLFPVWTTDSASDCAPTAPTSAGAYTVLADDDGVVRAYHSDTGILAWRYGAAGAILQAPATAQGRVYVGSGDGFVYCLALDSGTLIWKFRAAPVERRIMTYGRLASNWPVHSGVVVEEGVAYFAAGLIDTDGTYVYALDAATGAVKWANDSTGHLDPKLRKGVSAHGNITIQGGKLWLAGGNIAGPAPYDLETGVYLGEMSAGTGAPRANRGEELAVFADDFLVVGGRLRYSSLENVVSPGSFFFSKGNAFVRNVGKGRVTPAWNARHFVFLPDRDSVPHAYNSADVADSLRAGDYGRPLSMAWKADGLEGLLITGMALSDNYVAVTYAARPNRTIWYDHYVVLLDAETGALSAKEKLPSTPRLNGIAIDGAGRVLVALEDGRVACYGGDAAFRAYVEEVVRQCQNGETPKKEAVAVLRGSFNRVHDEKGREFVRSQLDVLGYDVFEAGRQAGSVLHWNLLSSVPYSLGEHPLDKVWVNEPGVNIAAPVSVAGKSVAWTPYSTTNIEGRINLAGIFGENTGRAAYAYAEIILPQAGEYILHLGSNDGYIAWFNEKEIGRYEGPRGFVPSLEALKIQGVAGMNHILVKVMQLGGAWDLNVQITDASGAPVRFEQPEEGNAA